MVQNSVEGVTECRKKVQPTRNRGFSRQAARSARPGCFTRFAQPPGVSGFRAASSRSKRTPSGLAIARLRRILGNSAAKTLCTAPRAPAKMASTPRHRNHPAGVLMPSFKVPCPSCEAPVLIKNPNLVGTKVECPKCKYRFKVEEPTAEGDANKKGDAKGATRKTRTRRPIPRRRLPPAGKRKSSCRFSSASGR